MIVHCSFNLSAFKIPSSYHFWCRFVAEVMKQQTDKKDHCMSKNNSTFYFKPKEMCWKINLLCNLVMHTVTQFCIVNFQIRITQTEWLNMTSSCLFATTEWHTPNQRTLQNSIHWINGSWKDVLTSKITLAKWIYPYWRTFFIETTTATRPILPQYL